MRVGWSVASVVVVVGLVVLGHAGRAEAYLMDAYDASVVEKGSLDLEIEPLGYLYVEYLGVSEHYLVTPSVIGILGLGSRMDLIVTGRGLVRVGGAPVMPRVHTRELSIDLRVLVRGGTYTESGEGPSIAVQGGALLPNAGWDPNQIIGGHAGVLLSQQWEGVGTLHANVFGARTPWQSWDLFLDAAFEGPPEWSVRPLVEFWFDYDTLDGGSYLPSVLGGVNIDLGESATAEAGVRYAAWDGYREVEIRAALWWTMELWDPGP